MNTTQSQWTPEQKAALVERLKPFDQGAGLVDWRAARNSGVLASIVSEFGRPEKTIRSYYNYTFRRHAWAVGRGPVKKRKYTHKVKAPAVTAKPVAEKPKATINYCPNCGANIAVHQAAANLHG